MVFLTQRAFGLTGHVVLNVSQCLLVDPLIGLGRGIELQFVEHHGVIGIRVP
ncbi:hypothetical protein D9M71_748380 [compost metagenome]